MTPTAITGDANVADQGGFNWLPWLAGLLVIGAAGGAIVLLRRRATSQTEIAPGAPASSPPAPTMPPRAIDPAPAREPAMLDRAPPAPGPVPAAELTLTLTPRRAGLNLISATAEAELVVRNDGPVPVQGVRVGSALLEAGNGQESAVAEYFTEAITRPAVAPFALEPGEERRVRIVVARARDAIRGVPANGRTMFVPVVAINILYQANGGSGQAARAFAIGVGRDGGSKLMPFWLDQPSGMFDGLEARSYGPAIVR
ncbi:hypothetical protein [Sphingomonas sp. MA1305]|uniref:hypothetical protein n=1 Tax=Sphingomonas sp. MA1305 TaxID=2479204 RepID=UPI0018E00C0F|nr:hypothetical protein [Sphingomonas sp. MA1305]